MDMTVANTILAQMGGRKFIAMTGAKSFVGSEDGLSFRFPAKSGPNACRVTLTPMDLYVVEFSRVQRSCGKLGYKNIDRCEGVYADQLQDVFTRATGLATHL